MFRLRGLKLFLTGVLGPLVVIGLTPVGASSANISHPYHASGSITNGSIVSLNNQQSDYIQLSNTDNGSLLTGVAVATNDSLLAVDPGAGTVQVATSGNVNTLVSTINGDIKVGDQIAVSPFSGVGMKSLPGSHVIGLAQTTFGSGTKGAFKQTVKDKHGKSSDIWLGYVRLAIAIGTDTSDASNGSNTSGLQKLAKSLTGHTVSTFRIVTGLVVALAAALAIIVLVYASIYGSIISVGRNPLAKYAVFRTLGSVLAMALLVAVVASATVFLLLR